MHAPLELEHELGSAKAYRCDTSQAPTDPTASPVLARMRCESANHRLVLTRR